MFEKFREGSWYGHPFSKPICLKIIIFVEVMAGYRGWNFTVQPLRTNYAKAGLHILTKSEKFITWIQVKSHWAKMSLARRQLDWNISTVTNKVEQYSDFDWPSSSWCGSNILCDPSRYYSCFDCYGRLDQRAFSSVHCWNQQCNEENGKWVSKELVIVTCSWCSGTSFHSQHGDVQGLKQ